MQITEVRVFPVDEEKLKAYASIVLDACFIVNDLKVIEGKRGLFISMPSRRRKRGGYRDVAHPLNNETRRMIEEGVLAEYQRALGDAGAGVRLAPHDEDMPDDERWHEPAVQPPPGAVVATPVAETPAPAAAADGRTSLEEVEQIHLRDSFWSVT
jgi:stage V sporulation protein G